MKILHCVYDDKFMDGTIRVYESDKRHTNEYVLVRSSPDNYMFRYIKSGKVKVTTPISFLLMAPEYDVIILHSFVCLNYYYISKIPKKCKVVWYAWGFDMYGGSHPIVPLKLYDTETKIFLEKDHLPKTIKGIITDLKVKMMNYYERLWLNKAISRIDYFSGVFPYEYDLVKSHHQNFKAKRVDKRDILYYGDIDFFIKDTINNDIEHGKVNIIIGNSADPRNNHHDALTAISNVILPKESNIIIPLSYAGSANYIQWVMAYAESLYPGRVKALLDYIPLQDYLDLTSHCKVAIFFHERQQASDNIFMQMMYGAKVYMSETSLAYKYLKDEGFIVFSLQSEAESLFDDITDEMVMTNRRLLCEKYSDHTIRERVFKIKKKKKKDIRGNDERIDCSMSRL